jgi:hypothetical protein
LDIKNKAIVDLTNVKQHGFKRNKRTSTLSSKLLSQIALAIDDKEYVVEECIDLSSPLDLVNVNLLIKNAENYRSPCDLIQLITVWLKSRL